MYTSLKLSKWLKEKGFDGESEYRLVSQIKDVNKIYHYTNIPKGLKLYILKSFDILNDLCVKYRKEIFGDNIDNSCRDANCYPACDCSPIIANEFHPEQIFIMMFNDKPQDEIEDYIMESSILK